ncbi:MAG: CDP-alcohol phosphatidyltransferase family protein, partial [Candidatus Dormibacteria bacterium]
MVDTTPATSARRGRTTAENDVMRRRAPIARSAGARGFVDATLADLKESRWSVSGWRRFLAANMRRSYADARLHKGAFAEVSCAHLLLWLAVRKPWPVVCWLMAATHLGLLGDVPRSVGWPNRVTLLRANLPALLPDTPTVAVLALATDFVDGQLARALDDETAFGAYGDALADVAFWTWFAGRFETNSMLRRTALAMTILPPVAVTAAYLARGRTLDYPRPLLGRKIHVALQALLTLRAIAPRTCPER